MSEENLFNYDLEVSVLGAIMQNNELLDRLSFLNEECFHTTQHKKIFKVLKEKIERCELANPITLQKYFDNDKEFTGVGGAKQYLGGCLVMASTFPIDSSKEIRDLSLRRSLIATLENSIAKIKDKSNEVSEESLKIAEICEKIGIGGKVWDTRNGEDVTQAIIDGMNTDLKAFSTGITRLDKAMDGGIYPGKLYGFGGRKKEGKTILAGTISCNLAIENVKHLFICGEMSPEEIHQRNLARMGGFKPSAFRTGYKNSEDFKQKFASSMQWNQKNILYRNAPGLNFEQLKQIIKRAIAQHKIKGFILDYLQLVGGKEPRKSMSEHQDEVAQWLADVCRKHTVFGIVMAQINQEGNTRGGEGLRLACDQLYVIQRPDISAPPMWLEMMDTRYTPWANIGSPEDCKLMLEPTGPWFKEV